MAALRARSAFLVAIFSSSVMVFFGCSHDDSGVIDLKKKADRPVTATEKPREFSKGDLEER